MEEEWDYLIVLTACRYDVFKKVNTIPGKLERRVSVASRTLEWAKKNFTGYYEDVIYVSANPRISNEEFDSFRGSDHFFKVINVWNGWDSKLNTILPDKVTEKALYIKNKYPNKRLIIHYLQPHAPWIGRIKISGEELGLSYSSPIEWYNRNSEIGLGLWGIWERALDMGISLNLIYKAYIDNLRLVLNEVKKLVNKLSGRIIITSTHGECFGEMFIIEHPEGVYISELVEIPWLIIEKDKVI